MKRRIFLLIGTFLLLSFAVGTYHLISADVLVLVPATEDFPDMKQIDPGKLSTLVPDFAPGWDVDILDKPEGRLRGRYRARKWTKRADGSYLLTGPHVVMYQSNGEHVYIRSDYGEVIADEAGGGWTVRRGSLYGGVKIFLDRDRRRNLDQEKPDEVFSILESGPDDPREPARVIRIYADNLRFNNDLLEVETDSRIAVLSDEADIYGRGISIRWNEEPRELRTLRVHHGQYMAIYQMAGQLGIFALPGAAREGAEPATRPATLPAMLAAATRPTTATATASAPVSRPTTAVSAASAPVSRPPPTTTRAATTSAPAVDIDAALATTRPTRPASRPVAKSHNIFLAEFEGTEQRLHVDSGERQLTGANKLGLIFEWGSQRGRPLQRLRRGRPAASQSVPGHPTSATASRPTTSHVPSRPTRPTRTGRPPAGPEPVIITWAGPLTIRPIGYTESPSSRRYTVWAEGHLTLTDPRASARCRRLIYLLPQQRGWLIGDERSDVHMTGTDEQEIVCRMLEFDRVGGMGYLTGPGYMARRTKSSGTASVVKRLGTTRPTTAASTGPAGEDRIAWGGTVVIAFGEKEFVDKEGGRHTRQYIRHATFRDNVLLTQGPSGDFMQCDKLYVDMVTDDAGRAYPARALATGNVLARQDTSDIRAQEVTVTFEREPEARKSGELRLRPVTMVARGEVGITDTRDNEILTASADHLRSDLVKRTAVLFGNDDQFATITQGPDYLAGDELHLDDAAESAVAKGMGELKFFTNRDLSGGELDKSRPIRVEWDEGMRYSAASDAAEFNGNVVLSSALDSIQCRKMRVMFEKLPGDAGDEDKEKRKTKAEAKGKAKAGGARGGREASGSAAAARPRPGRSLGVGMRQYSRRRLSMVVADGDVAVRSREEDQKKRLLQRLQITGSKLVYDVSASKLQVLGPGTLVAEDYRKPKSDKAESDEAESDKPKSDKAKSDEAKKASEPADVGVERPWQTLFEWQKSMEYSQLKRRVKLLGRAAMVHRSGKQVRLGQKLNIPEWKNIPRGRKSMLSCQELLAVFAAPEPKEGKDKDVTSRGPRLGPLELFTATGDVNLRDGFMQILGQRLVYDHKKGEAVVWGSLPDKPVKNAEVHHEDLATRKHQSWTSPTITVHFEGREIKEVITKGLTASGGS